VRLLLKILETQRQHGEVVKILESENLGVNSQIVRGDRTFHGLMVDNLLLADNMWDRAFSYVQSLYTVPDDEDGQKKLLELDEWKIWNLLYQSALRSEDSGLVDPCH
jgi:N-terminal acetyltransferase B complex non-catalytic subunit